MAGHIAAAVQGELDRVSQTLTGRIRQLAERYATPLPKLTDEVEALATRVDGHLKRWGRYGSEARLQADGGWRHPGGMGGEATRTLWIDDHGVADTRPGSSLFV